MAGSVEEEYSTLKYNLNNRLKMPAVGFGTFRIKTQEDITQALDNALEAGYRLIDTAAVYHNEQYIQTALRTLLPKYGLERDDIFITTKLSPSDHGTYDVVKRAYDKSLERLGLDYVDLYLIHFPGTSRYKAQDVQNKKLRDETWSSMEQLYDQGLVKAIGVSNFTTRHLQELMQHHSVIPAVNQVELHPYYNQEELLKFCKAHEIVVQAYSSLGGTSSNNYSLLSDNVIQKIAQKHQVSPAQVLLLWALKKNIAIIPKSTNAERIKLNMSYKFRLSDEDMKKIDELGASNMKYAWDPVSVA